MPQEEYKPNDDFAPFREAMRAAGACGSGMEYYDTHEFETNAQAFGNFETSEETRQSWGLWCLKTLGEKIAPQLRLNLIAKITTPMEALVAYRVCRSFLTQPEINLLKAKYEGKLPVAEDEVEDGSDI